MKKRSLLLGIAGLLAAFLVTAPFAYASDSGSVLTTGTGTEPLNVKRNTVVSNLFAFGSSLSGKTLDQALETVTDHVDAMMNASLRAESADKDAEWEETFAELGITFDEQTMRNTVKGGLLTGSILSRYKKAKDYEASPVTLSLGTVFNEEYILETVKEALSDWNRDPIESTATCVTGELVVNVGQNGHEYVIEPGIKAFTDALKNDLVDEDGYDLELEFTTVEATLSPERVADFTVIGSCTTEYERPTSQVLVNRQKNLMTSTHNMSGRVFAPGETISALNLYGSVSIAGGYAIAGTYTTGGHTEEVGGGICQTTSTMYNAVLMAELEVVYRKNHSYLVGYLDPSMDAMVYAAGGSDFKFKNTSSDYIIIDAYVNTEDYTITVNIIGHEDHPETHSVRYEAEILALELPTLTNITDPNYIVGFSNTMKYNPGNDFICIPYCKSRLWKVTTDDGVETRTAVGGIDTYKPMNASITVAPDIVATLRFTQGRNMALDLNFIDSNKTPLAADPVRWTAEQRIAFNAEMKEIMAEKGYDWPDTGDKYTRYIKQDDGSWGWTVIYEAPGSGEEGGDAGDSGDSGDTGDSGEGQD